MVGADGLVEAVHVDLDAAAVWGGTRGAVGVRRVIVHVERPR